MESHILQHQNDRAEAFRPNAKLDKLIDQLRLLLSPLQEEINRTAGCPSQPVVLVVGCPRSGTTFVTQLLGATGAFAYPSNLLSRFAFAPHLGALIEQLLLDPEYRLGSEFADLVPPVHFSSNVGKTEGLAGVNEFFHFWRRFFPNHDPGYLSPGPLSQVDVIQMRAEIASIQSVHRRPFMSKGMMLQYNLEFFAERLPELRIVYVKRDPLYVMQSIWQARIKYYGTDKIWWSVKPREYDDLRDREPSTQIAGQVLSTNAEINRQTLSLSSDRFIAADYEQICNDPRAFLHDLAERFAIPEVTAGVARVDERYASGNVRRLDDDRIARLEASYAELSANFSGHLIP